MLTDDEVTNQIENEKFRIKNHFTKAGDAFLRSKRLDNDTKMLYLLIKSYGDNAYLSISTLSNILGIQPQKVKRKKAILVEVGLLTSIKRPYKSCLLNCNEVREKLMKIEDKNVKRIYSVKTVKEIKKQREGIVHIVKNGNLVKINK